MYLKRVFQAAASLIMTKEENVEVQEKERHDREQQEEGRVQREEEEEEALTEEEEEEEDEDEDEDEDDYELEDEKEGEKRVEVDDNGERQEEVREDREEQEEEAVNERDGEAAPDPEPLPASEYQSPIHEPRRRPMVHPAAQAPLPKDYSMSYHLKYTPLNIHWHTTLNLNGPSLNVRCPTLNLH